MLRCNPIRFSLRFHVLTIQRFTIHAVLSPCGPPRSLSIGGRGQARSASPVRTASPEVSSRRRIPRESDSQQGEALDQCLPLPSLLALFEDSYLVTNVNCSGDERRLANCENRFALVNHHAGSL